MKTYVHLWQYLAVSFVKLEVFQNCRENQNTNFMFSNFFSESRAVCEIMWKKNGRAGEVTDDNTLHAG